MKSIRPIRQPTASPHSDPALTSMYVATTLDEAHQRGDQFALLVALSRFAIAQGMAGLAGRAGPSASECR